MAPYATFNGAPTDTQAHTYTTELADTFRDPVQIDAPDRAGNLGSYLVDVINGAVVSNPVITVPATISLTFTLVWCGLDSASGIRLFDVQYKHSYQHDKHIPQIYDGATAYVLPCLKAVKYTICITITWIVTCDDSAIEQMPIRDEAQSE